MSLISHFALFCIFFSLCLAGPLHKRAPAYVDSPSYAPQRVSCPKGFAIRTPALNGPLSSGESTYVSKKAAKAVSDWQAYLNQAGLKGFDTKKFLCSARSKGGIAAQTLPNFAIAASGGGARAALNGAGILYGLDARNPAAKSAKVGGVLQLANYLVGLSGGSWLMSSIAVNDFPTTAALNSTVWDLQENLLAPRADSPLEDAQITADVAAKQAAGFPISIVDVYGRALSYHFINDSTYHGSRTLFNGIQTTPSYHSNAIPFPIIVGTSRKSGTDGPTLNGSIYEFNPVEFGLFDPSLNAFVNMSNMGTLAVSKKPVNGCVIGFDNAGFNYGISSDIFGDPGVLAGGAVGVLADPTIQALLGSVPDDVVDTGRIPSSFQGLGATTGYAESSQAELNLVDGGLAGENVPFWPIQQPARHIDVVIAIDSSADTSGNYPNGTAPYTTYLKSQLPRFKNYPFPVIPEAFPVDTFAMQGLNKRPVFFGCTKKTNPHNAPLIVYLPNYNQTYAGTGTSTFAPSYTQDQAIGFFNNGAAIAAQNVPSASTYDPNWSACLACALVDRQNTRNGMARTAQCSKCFATYCA